MGRSRLAARLKRALRIQAANRQVLEPRQDNQELRKASVESYERPFSLLVLSHQPGPVPQQ